MSIFAPAHYQWAHRCQDMHLERAAYFGPLKVGIYSRGRNDKKEKINMLAKKPYVMTAFSLPDYVEDSAYHVVEERIEKDKIKAFCFGIEGMNNQFEMLVMKLLLNDNIISYTNIISDIDKIRTNSSKHHNEMNKLRIKYGDIIPEPELENAQEWLKMGNNYYPFVYVNGEQTFFPIIEHAEDFAGMPILIITELEKALVRVHTVNGLLVPEEICIRAEDLTDPMQMIADADGQKVYAKLNENNKIAQKFYSEHFGKVFRVKGGSGRNYDDNFVNIPHIHLENGEMIRITCPLVERVYE